MTSKLDRPTLIVPIGAFPHPAGEQVIDRAAALRMVGQLARLGRDIVVDYMHESLRECGRAPAAGWVKTGTARLTDKGITAAIGWTDDARGQIEAGKYMYLSPVFEARGGRITGLVNLGLTNNPNINAMPPLCDHAANKEIKMKDQTKHDAASPDVASDKPTIASLLGDTVALLGLAPDASDEEVIAKLEELAKQSAEARDAGVEQLVNDAISAGRLRPSQRQWASRLGKDNPESLRIFLVNSGPAIPLGGVITQCHSGNETRLTESETGVIRLLNLTEEDFLKYGN